MLGFNPCQIVKILDNDIREPVLAIICLTIATLIIVILAYLFRYLKIIKEKRWANKYGFKYQHGKSFGGSFTLVSKTRAFSGKYREKNIEAYYYFN